VNKKTFYETTSPDALEAAVRSAPIEDSVEDGERFSRFDEAEEKRYAAENGSRQKAYHERIRASAAAGAPKANRPRLLYRSRDAMAAIGCGHTKFYDLINTGILDARRFGKRTYITVESLEAFVASLPRAVPPTIAKAEHEAWAGRRNFQPKIQVKPAVR
jgi:hypothetical protein